MGEVALARGRAGISGEPHRAFGNLAAFVMNGDASGRDLGPVAFVEVTDFLGQRRQCQGIGAQIHLTLTKSHGQRAAPPRANHQLVFPCENNGQGEGPLQPSQRRPGGVHWRHTFIEIASQQMGHHFGIGVGEKLMVHPFKLRT